MQRITVILGLCICLAACGDDDSQATRDAGPAVDAATDGAADALVDAGPTGPVEVVFEAAATSGFFAQPFPLDTRRSSDGRPDLTGYPNPRRVPMVDLVRELAEERTVGFSTTGPIYFSLTGPIDPASLPSNAEASVEPASSVFVVDVDPASPELGRIVPVIAQFQSVADTYRPAWLLGVLPQPGFNLREDTLYAAVLRTSLRPADPMRPVQVSSTIRALLGDAVPADAMLADEHTVFAPLRSYLATRSLSAADIFGATVFRTDRVSDELFDFVEHVRELPALAPVGALTKIVDRPTYCAYRGEWDVPQFQRGTPPFEAGGDLALDGSGRPVEQRVERGPFVVAVPKRAMPTDGFPLFFYVNGTGGLARQVLDRGPSIAGGPPVPGSGPADVVASIGFGASGVAGPLTPERIGSASADGIVMYNFTNPRAMRDNFFQAIAEHVMFRRLVTTLRLDVSDCVGVDVSAASDSRARFDDESVVGMGQSLGSYLLGMLAATDSGFDAIVLSGAGGGWVEFPFGVRFVDLLSILELTLNLRPSESLDRFHPLITGFTMGVGPSDNLNYARFVLREPRDGRVPPHVLVIEGHDDDNVGDRLQAALVAQLGVDFVGAEVGPTGEQILPNVLLAGRARVDPPIVDNVTTPVGARTGGVVRYAPAVAAGGHYIAFESPEAVRQYRCFAESSRVGSARIVAPAPLATPCE